MTKEEILAMKPGRELDALVAVRVFGWIVENNRCLISGTISSSEREWMWLKRYSTDISAAWEVVKVLSKNYGVDVYEDDGAPCECTLVRYPETIAVAEGETAPEAICKAALLACLEEK